MEAQKNEFFELAEKNGWKVTELDNFDFHKWSMETWRLDSVLSPINTKACISFLIDPQSDLQNPYAWAIEVSDEKPVYGKERNNFLNFLSDIRNQTN